MPFLLLSVRPEQAAGDDEHAAFLACTGLDERDLVRRRLDQEPLGEVDLAGWSGVLLGGSPFTTTDADRSPLQQRVEAELRALLQRVVAEDVPFLGACYGMGTLGGAVGAVVDRTYGEPVGAVRVSLTPEGCEDPLTGVLPETFEAFVGHKEAVSRLPPSAVLLASSPTCPVQAFRVGRNAYATQFHPELDVDGIRGRIRVYQDAGYFPPEQVDVLLEAVGQAAVEHPPRLLRRFVELYG